MARGSWVGTISFEVCLSNNWIGGKSWNPVLSPTNLKRTKQEEFGSRGLFLKKKKNWERRKKERKKEKKIK